MDRNAFYTLHYGIYLITVKEGENASAQVANALIQVTSEPPRIAVSLNVKNYTCELIRRSGLFTVTVLGTDADMQFIGRYGFRSGRDFRKLDGATIRTGSSGQPIITDHGVAYLEARTEEVVELGTHCLFVAEVTDAGMLSEGSPLTYEYYRVVLGGKSPRYAPTFQLPVDREAAGDEAADTETMKGGVRITTEADMSRYRCVACGYIYDPEKGDPDSGIAPGTPFEKIPDDWVCPVCGVSKDMFEKVE